MKIFKKDILVEYVMLDEHGNHSGRKTKVCYNIWFWQSVGDIFTELKMEHGYDNFAVLSVRRL
ncbi:hypothetical protein NoPa_00142 [Pseudomonas phage vB_PpuM-NoPa]|uniref:Uncharacterized protein n=4 Tax=Tartuvirus TaxID=3424912 RepID=A0AAX4MXJ5_9CAUD